MASRNFLIPGLDPSLGTCLPLTDLLQMFEQSAPSTDTGWVFLSETTPNTVAYPELARFLWLKSSNGDLKYYDGSSWEYVVAQAVVGNSSVTMASLDASEGLPRQIPQINAGGTAYALVSPSSIFNNGELPLAKLASSTTGHVPFFTGGTWTTTSLDAFIRVIINDEPLPADGLYAAGGGILAGQIPYFPTVPGNVDYAYVEDIMRLSATPTNRLSFAFGSAGKFVKINAGGTDFDYVDSSMPSGVGTVAVLSDSQVSGTAPQSIPAGVTTTLRLAASVAQSWVSVASNEFTLKTGTYLVSAAIPYTLGGTDCYGYAALVTGSTNVSTLNIPRKYNDPSGLSVSGQLQFTYPLEVTTPTAYKFQIRGESATILVGSTANSIVGIAEVYTVVNITKLL